MDADLDLPLSTGFVTALRVGDSSSRVVLPFRQKINASAACSPSCPSSPGTSNAAAGWRTRWSA
jgi:hypothetical protein